MSRRADYRATLRTLTDWAPYLLAESNLPGPRANLELLAAVADEGDTPRLLSLLDHDPDCAPTGTPGEFVAACGAAGLGARIAAGESAVWPRLRALAGDPRWRVREGVAMGLQRIGDADMERLLKGVDGWVDGTPLERRAAAAGLCEPRLLGDPGHAEAVLGILGRLTASLAAESDPRAEDVRVLRKALGYCWSVAIVASPSDGKACFERWTDCASRDVHWVLRENLRKVRLGRMDAAWVAEMQARLA
jgi:hypothetical protein